MKYITFIIVFFTTLIFLSCEKQIESKPICLYCNTDTSKLQLIWSEINSNDSLGARSMAPIITDYGVLFSSYYHKDDAEVISLRDKKDGHIIWSWNDWNVYTDVSVSHFVKDDKLIILDHSHTYVISLIDGQTIWKSSSRPNYYGNPQGWIEGDKIYKSLYRSLRDSVNKLIVSPIDHQEWDTVLTLVGKDSYIPDIQSVKLWMAPSGDSILVFQNRSWSFKKTDGKIDLYAYNLSKRKIQWIKEDIDPDGNSHIYAITIVNNICVFNGSYGYYGFDLNTGNRLWQKKTSELALCISYLIGDILYVKSDNDIFLRLDVKTGRELSRYTGAGNYATSLVYFKNKFYCLAADELNSYDMYGKKLFSHKSPFYYKPLPYYSVFPGIGSGGCPIDPSTELMYIADEKYVMCIKVPQ